MNEIYPYGLAWKRKEQPFSTGSSVANINDVLQSDYIFIDWLSMSQRHYDLLPKINGSVIVKFDEYGLLTYEMLGFKSHLGSFESTINVRSDGDVVSISGNPSKYNKLDNLFGLQSLVDCVSLFNSILSEYDLPPLEMGKATISRVDITQNYIVGSGNERDHIRYLSSVNYRNESGYVYPDGNAVDWFRHSTRHYLKVYNKSAELERHLKKAIKKNLLEPQQNDYLNRLIDESGKLGVVRVEYEIKSNILRDKNLRIYQGEKMGELVHLFKNKNPYFEKAKYITTNDAATIYEIAVSVGFTPRVSRTIELHYESWLNGSDLRQKYSSSQFALIRSKLKKCGVDISKPMDVSRLSYVMKELQYIPAGPSQDYLNYELCVRRLASS